MPGVMWNTEAQRKLVSEHLEGYVAAHKKGNAAIKRWWPGFMVKWFKQFPLREELVEKGKLGEHAQDEKYKLNIEESAIFKKAMDARVGQIKTLFRYLQSREYGNVGKGVGGGNKNGVSHAAKVFGKKQRRVHNKTEVFYQLNQERLEPMIAEAVSQYKAKMDEDGDEDVDEDDEDDEDEADEDDQDKECLLAIANKADAKKRGWNLTIRAEIIKREFAKASEEDLKAVERAINKEREDMEREADLDLSGRGLARSAKLRKEALDRSEAFMVENGKTAWNLAAMTTITFGVAPDPEDGGKFKSIVVAYGKNADGKLFTDVNPDFAKQLIKPLRIWAKANLYTPDQYEDALGQHNERIAKQEKLDEVKEDEGGPEDNEGGPEDEEKRGGADAGGSKGKTSPAQKTPQTTPNPSSGQPTQKATASPTRSSTSPSEGSPISGDDTGKAAADEDTPKDDAGKSPANGDVRKTSTKGAVGKSSANSDARKAPPGDNAKETSAVDSALPDSQPPSTAPSRPRPKPIKKKSKGGPLTSNDAPDAPSTQSKPDGDHVPPQTLPPATTSIPSIMFNLLPPAGSQASVNSGKDYPNPADGPSEPMEVGLRRARTAVSSGHGPEADGPEAEGGTRANSVEQDSHQDKDLLGPDDLGDDADQESEEDEISQTADASFSGGEFWARLKTNIPTNHASKSKKTSGKGTQASAGKGKSSKQPASATSKKNVNGSASNKNPAEGSPTDTQASGAKRKTSPAPVEPAEEGRSKRRRVNTVLPDGTTFSGPASGLTAKGKAVATSKASAAKTKTTKKAAPKKAGKAAAK